ncbi:hypothetical protein HPB47_012266, partial [Ixodes persulcatus]
MRARPPTSGCAWFPVSGEKGILVVEPSPGGLAPPSEPRPFQVPSGNREAVAQPPPTKKPEVAACPPPQRGGTGAPPTQRDRLSNDMPALITRSPPRRKERAPRPKPPEEPSTSKEQQAPSAASTVSPEEERMDGCPGKTTASTGGGAADKMGGTDNVFGAVDYAVFTVMLLVSALIGVYYRFTGDRQRTAREYLVANKNMSVVPVSFSLMASFMSAVTLLGVPSENYFYGTQFLLINVAYIFGTPLAAFVFLPVFYKMQIVSVYEYLEKRFGRATRLAASATFVIQMVFYMAVVLYAPAVALSAVTGISKWLSIISVGLVCTFYCTIGGMKAVLWTDLFQSLLMYIAMISVVVVGTYNLGGLDKVWQEAQEGGRIEFFNFDPDPTVRHTVWTLAVGGIFVYVSLYGVNQAQVQRLMTVSSLRKAQVALFINWPLVSALSIVTSFTGLVMYANFRHCDPLKACRISKQDQVLPHFVMVYLGHVQGLPGLFVAGIFSGALSTVSSAVNSLAAVMLEDFVRPFCISPKTYDTHASLIVKVLAFFFGILCVLLTGVVEQLGGVLQASFIIFGVVGGPLLGLFTLGVFSSKTNQA